MFGYLAQLGEEMDEADNFSSLSLSHTSRKRSVINLLLLEKSLLISGQHFGHCAHLQAFIRCFLMLVKFRNFKVNPFLIYSGRLFSFYWPCLRISYLLFSTVQLMPRLCYNALHSISIISNTPATCHDTCI